MTLVLVLLLVGNPATDGRETVAEAGQRGSVRGSASTQTRESNGPFRSPDSPKVDPGASQELDAAPHPAVLPRVVCTLRVIKANPSVDPGFVMRLPANVTDPIVRDDLSRCVE